MHKAQWQLLRLSLIKGGVPIWRVGRTVAEIQDHYADLQDEARRAGLPADQAAADAAERLGDVSRLADQYLQCSDLTSRWARSSVVQLCIAGDGWISHGRYDIAVRWSCAALAAAVFTSSLLLILHLTIFGN
jgi:hypothetical protein